MTSQRDAVATLVAICESEEAEHQELEQFLMSHSAQLAHSLGTSIAALFELAVEPPSSRRTGVRRLLQEGRRREQAAHVSASQNLSLAAASMVALSAVWEGGEVILAARIVLGRNLLADRGKRFIRFDVEGQAPVAVRREKLSEAGKALKFPDVQCSVSAAGLRFRWRQGKGGLLLTNQKIDARHRDAVLPIVIVKRREELVERHRVPTRGQRTGWLSDVFGELSAF